MFTLQPFLTKRHLLKPLLMLFLLLITFSVTAQQAAASKPPSTWSNPLAITLLMVILALLLIIFLLANVLLGTAKLFTDKERKKAKAFTVFSVLFTPLLSTAQDAVVTAPAVSSYSGLSATTFWLLVTVIIIELLVIVVMSLFVKRFLAKEEVAFAAKQTIEKPAFVKTWWDKFNRFKPVEQEADMDLGHDYDGIRELDNRLPPWWLYGFYVTILIAGIYLWRYHIAETAPLSKQEYEIAMRHAEEEKAVYLAKAANNIDENTVVMLTEATALNAGKNNFVQMCAACHGKAGEGAVGPNLTDDYWLNGGSIKDVFKMIKYGRPEKGMKSWQEDYSPIQIAQLASFIKSLKGTNPPNGKEKQGELYKETAEVTVDSTAVKEVAVNH
ncbi:MAG: c-type cytochrome [Chitinophagaceae bacterium]|jgi:cytochrome c oxidase cbb3-type subunit III|nr:c-type cytochrome [Chitinophagaceae bacterium]